MSIYRQHRTQGWSHLPNDIVEDSSLSFRAKGLLWYLLSRSDEWKPKGRQLATVSTEGRDAVYTARGELVDAGYLVEVREREPDGRFATVTHVFDTPSHTPADVSPGPENPDPAVTSGNAANPQVTPGPGKPDPGYPGSGQPGPLPTTETPTTEHQEQTSLSGPAARDQDQQDTSTTGATPTEKAKAAIAKIDADPDRRVAIELTTYMRRKLREHDIGVPDRGTLTSLRWVADMDLLLRRGAPDTEAAPVAADDVRAVIDYVVADGFWRGNVRCPDKLRRQWEPLRHKARRARSPFADPTGGDGPAEGTAEWWAAYRTRDAAGDVVDAEVVDVQRTA